MLENSTNNNKYLNMMIMQREGDENVEGRTDNEETTEHTVYLLPFDLL